MSFFSIPLSGLNANQNALRSVSNNLANENTDGYKDQNVTFNDVFAQSGIANGALDPLQTGQGVGTASTTSKFTDGNVVGTGIDSNLALSGNGFFVVQQTNGSTAYSRAGDFTTSKTGQLVAPDGSLVLGYPAQNGIVQTTAALQPINVGSGVVIPAVTTTTFGQDQNLNASSAVGTVVTGSAQAVYDSLGGAHQLAVTYTKTAANSWSYAVSVPTADTGAASSTVATGTLSFDTSGKLTGSSSTTGGTNTPNPPGTVPGISIPSYTDGAAASTLTWNLNDANGNPTITQSALTSATATLTQNGNAASSLKSFSVDADGTVQGLLYSGKITALGQVAVASVTNTQGLQQIGNNLFQITAGSGSAVVGAAGSGGRGTITGGSVEQSNVDVASEFSKLIVAQQSYDANAKSITTFNQISQATLAIIP